MHIARQIIGNMILIDKRFTNKSFNIDLILSDFELTLTINPCSDVTHASSEKISRAVPISGKPSINSLSRYINLISLSPDSVWLLIS